MTRSLTWMDQAACRGADPELFFPEEHGAKYTAAKRICAACPVRQQCTDYSEDFEQGACKEYRDGCWGGMSPSVRAEEARRSGVANLNTNRRNKILHLAAAGLDATAIADQVGCSDRTVWRITKQHREPT